MIEQVKICTTGLQMLDKISSLMAQAKWVGLGSFGFDTSMACWRFLPQHSQIVVGLPREPEKRSLVLARLGALKERRPDLHIATRGDFHAKYGLFRLPRSLWVSIGSANCTPSPAKELVVISRSDQLFESMARLHDRWFVDGDFVKPYNMPKLSRQELRKLSSLVVED